MSNHQKHIVPLDFATISAWEFVGNHHSDCVAFADIEAFAKNPNNDTHQRAEALRIMGMKGMGLSADEFGAHLTDLELLRDFLDSIEAEGDDE